MKIELSPAALVSLHQALITDCDSDGALIHEWWEKGMEAVKAGIPRQEFVAKYPRNAKRRAALAYRIAEGTKDL